jgi:uracil-DNA glycosylase
MGLKDGPSLGSMNATRQFEAECALFLREQIRIVKPSAIVAFGAAAYQRVKTVAPSVIHCTHPSAREFIPLATRAKRVRERADQIREALARAAT